MLFAGGGGGDWTGLVGAGVGLDGVVEGLAGATVGDGVAVGGGVCLTPCACTPAASASKQPTRAHAPQIISIWQSTLSNLIHCLADGQAAVIPAC
jgi:hypothetical protein